MNDIVSLDRHPILMQAYEVCRAIEECGCSEELTAAVTKASSLLDALKQIVVEIEQLAKERDSQYDYNVEQIARQAALEAEIEELQKRIEWQPIETAPKDRVVLLYANHIAKLGHFNTQKEHWVDNLQHRPLHYITHWKDAVLPLPTEEKG